MSARYTTDRCTILPYEVINSQIHDAIHVRVVYYAHTMSRKTVFIGIIVIISIVGLMSVVLSLSKSVPSSPPPAAEDTLMPARPLTTEDRERLDQGLNASPNAQPVRRSSTVERNRRDLDAMFNSSN